MALNETSKCDRSEREFDLEHFARDFWRERLDCHCERYQLRHHLAVRSDHDDRCLLLATLQTPILLRETFHPKFQQDIKEGLETTDPNCPDRHYEEISASPATSLGGFDSQPDQSSSKIGSSCRTNLIAKVPW